MLTITTDDVTRDLETDDDNNMSFTYNGTRYNLDNFTTLPAESQEAREGWHGGMAETVFSGILVRLDLSENTVVVGRWSE